MVVFHDRRGGKIKISLLDAIIPGVGRPTVRRESASKLEAKKDEQPNEPPAKQASEKPAEHGVATGSQTDPDGTRKAEAVASGAIDPEKQVGGFTEAQDKELIELKDAKKSWQEITAATGKTKKSLTKRYGELMKDRKKAGTEGASPAAEKGKEAKEIGKDADGEKKQKERQESQESIGGKSEVKNKPSLAAEDDWSAIDPGNDDDGHVTSAPAQVVEGQNLDMQEILYICRMHNYFNDQKWVALSAKLFDKTGKRISPEALRQKFEDEKLI